MLAKLADPSRPLGRLLAEGYETEVRQQHLLVSSVPYVNPSGAVRRGTLVCTYVESGGALLPPDNHQVWFVGEQPCFSNGTPITQIENEHQRRELAPGLWTDRRFSNKPAGLTNFATHEDKMLHYLRLLQDQARVLEPTADARTGRAIESPDEESVFRYLDTSSARSETLALSMRLAMERVAIIGLGGTGSYVLDHLIKTLIKQIHTFDPDVFLQHNAFRAPGAATLAEIAARMPKVHYHRLRCDPMHRGIYPHAYAIDESNVSELSGFDFVFVCVDKGPARALIARYLIAQKVPFIDVGMAVEQVPESHSLVGLARATLCTPERNAHFFDCAPTDNDARDALYRRNIQVDDLNALNALLAVFMWKQFCGYYANDFNPHHLTFAVSALSLGRSQMAPDAAL